jgi:hypothetical protein
MPLDSTLGAGGEPPLSASEARATGAEAFAFGFPLLLTALSLEQGVEVDGLAAELGPLNRFAHFDAFADPEFRALVAVNSDTLYSVAWLDLAGGPLVLTLPDTGKRSFMVSIASAWSETVACLDTVAPGSAGGTYLLIRDGCSELTPAGMVRLELPTDLALVIGHVHARNGEDLGGARAVQVQLALTSQSTYGEDLAPADAIFRSSAPARSPVGTVAGMAPEDFLARLASEMRRNPPSNRDEPILRRLATVGVVPGEPFEWGSHSPEVDAALRAGFADGKSVAASPPPEEQLANGWRALGPELGDYGTDYARRAQTANLALGTILPEDACFPICGIDSDGRQTDGARSYRLRFEPHELPKVEGLWSLVVYDMDQLFVSNAIDRYAVGDRDELTLGEDGSLEILIQRDEPADPNGNWLPAPEGDFYLMLHMYCPRQEMLDGSWSIPPIVRVTGAA